MDWSDYEVEGQLSIFDLMETKNDVFNPLELLALHGTGFCNGMARVEKYFNENHTLAEKVKFLKKEYGTGGFGSPIRKPCYIYQMNTFGSDKKDIVFSYCDENMNSINSDCSFEQLAKTITNMIIKGTYKENKETR